jgi:hypothetical protein
MLDDARLYEYEPQSEDYDPYVLDRIVWTIEFQWECDALLARGIVALGRSMTWPKVITASKGLSS